MDGILDPFPELPQAVETTETAVSRRARVAGLLGQTLLVSLVMGLGLLHGSRTALGGGLAAPAAAATAPDVSAPPAADPEAAPPEAPADDLETPAVPSPEIAAPPERLTDWHRGRFYRPPGSTATRPEMDLHPQVWLPRPRLLPQLARACPSEAPRPGC